MRHRKLILIQFLAFLGVFSIFSLSCQLTSYLQDPALIEVEAISTPTESLSTSVPVMTQVMEHSPTPPVGNDLMGVEIHHLDNLETASEAGAEWIRNVLVWHLLEVEEGNRDWSATANLEEELIAASERDLGVLLSVRGAPEWAQKVEGSYCGPIKAEKLSAFGTFIAEAVARFSQPPFHVYYWEFGNEPDVEPALVSHDSVFGCWGDSGDPYYGGGYYAEMLKAVYPQIKAVDPQAQVLVGGLLLDCDPINPPETQPGSGEIKNCTPSRFLEGILSNGGGNYFDGVSFHAYDYYATRLGQYSNINWHSSWDTTGPVVVPKARFLKNVLASFGYGNKYLINSESALLCGRDATEDYCQTEEFALTKAYYLAQSFAAARAEGLRANIWYSLRGWRGSGLVDQDQQPNLAYQSFAFSAELLEGSAYVGEVGVYPNIKGYEFTKDGVRTWLIWAQDEQTHAVHLDEQPSAIYDAMGNALPASQDINVTLAPVYVQWSP